MHQQQAASALLVQMILRDRPQTASDGRGQVEADRIRASTRARGGMLGRWKTAAFAFWRTAAARGMDVGESVKQSPESFWGGLGTMPAAEQTADSGMEGAKSRYNASVSAFDQWQPADNAAFTDQKERMMYPQLVSLLILQRRKTASFQLSTSPMLVSAGWQNLLHFAGAK